MAAVPRCSECSAPLLNEDGSPKPAGTKTDTPYCRNKRSRRLKRARREASQKSPFAPEVRDMAAAVRNQTTDVAHEVMKEQLAPIVREAMTAEVLRGIDQLVKLNPRAIELLGQQMESDDETIAQRAITLALKFTMGNPSVAPPPSVQAPSPMTVNFGIPRPGDSTAELEPAHPGEAEELRTCTDCDTDKPTDQFVGASPRCQECFDGLHETLRERFAVVDESKPS